MNKSQLHTPFMTPSAHTSATSITDMMFAPATAVCNRPVFLFFFNLFQSAGEEFHEVSGTLSQK